MNTKIENPKRVRLATEWTVDAPVSLEIAHRRKHWLSEDMEMHMEDGMVSTRRSSAARAWPRYRIHLSYIV